ncbi:MAG: hypothetical protein ORN51_15650 [Akkermansiaceae bacterium]|nr:hypothetical protein [Akkermansiaceae bacterium]
MTLLSRPIRSALFFGAVALLPLSLANAAEPIRIVFQNGRSVPVSAVILQNDNLVVQVIADGFGPGQTFPLASADHVYGERPTELDPAIALVLMKRPGDALKPLEGLLESQRVTAKIPGNFWLETARAALVAFALNGDAAKCTEIGKQISDATPVQGIDPFVVLGKALLAPVSTSISDREVAFRDLTTDNLPADLGAYASLLRAELLNGVKRDGDPAKALQQENEILEAYLAVPCLFPSGGMVLNAVAELKAAEILATRGSREEAISLLKSCVRNSSGTLVAVEATKQLDRLK